MMKYLSICAILAISGCASTPQVPIGLPVCERPIAVDAEIWNSIDNLRATLSYNSAVDAKCIEKLRKRIKDYDSSIEVN